jgi:hypothetical protein
LFGKFIFALGKSVMMKRKFQLLIIYLLVSSTLLGARIVYAHPGRTASDGCHYCRTNCDKWGETWGARHCHGGGARIPLPLKEYEPVKLPSKKSIETDSYVPKIAGSEDRVIPNNKDKASTRDLLFGGLIASTVIGSIWYFRVKNK